MESFDTCTYNPAENVIVTNMTRVTYRPYENFIDAVFLLKRDLTLTKVMIQKGAKEIPTGKKTSL